ncbi:hypothetical protein [Sulfitobacter aestuariivivens]|uniref:hypothetical protein n=1 Tax=Sulfitobacter aestuariivivens TaxID=2766981 RepID=UPI003622E52B
MARQGGPPVKAPTRRGFGSTIIENTIPFELKGKVETRYLVSGFEADLLLPANAVAGTQQQTAAAEDPAADAPSIQPVPATSGGEFLVLEDNMIIALEATDILSSLGADQVHMASNCEDAIALIGERSIRFALLDVNLGDQTSISVAEVLAAKGIPFVLATGYGDADEITGVSAI